MCINYYLEQIKIRNSSQGEGGFTLVELILYVALVAIFITGATYFVWDVIYGREKAYQEQIVNQSGRIAMEKIAYEIRRTKDIESVSSDQIVLDNGGTTTTISLNATSGTVEIIPEGQGPFSLTSNQVKVTSLEFSDLSSSEEDLLGEDSKNIRTSLTIEQVQIGVPGQPSAVITLTQSIELNSQFNQARRILVDLSNATLVTDTSLQGITIQNTGLEEIAVDSMEVLWTETVGGENVVEVQIGGGTSEWVGSEGSGELIDLVDFTLAPPDGVVDIDYVDFDSNMEGAGLSVKFIFTDSSSTIATLVLGTLGDPYSTCAEYCLGNGFSAGTCRKNASSCSDNGEEHQLGGDLYCTGGPNTDTCCCLP